MRKIRILLLLVAAGAIAAIFVPTASALGFEDEPCPPQPQLKVCHPDAEVGKAYSLTIVGKGGCYPDSVRYSVVNSALPPGLSLTSGKDALISGVPTKAGQYRFWLQIQDILASQGGASWCTTPDSSCGCARTSQWEFQITVQAGLQIQQRQSVLAPAQIGTPYSLQLTATGGTPTWSYSGSLPPGITLNNSTGLLSGTPTTAGDYNFKITATAGSSTDTQTYKLSVVEPLKIAKPTATGAEVGFPFRLQLSATGGRAPYKWSATGLPSGFAIDAATGVISGTADAPNSSVVKVTVTDALGLTNTIEVNFPVAAKLALQKTALPSARVGVAYSARLVRIGGLAPFKWTVISAARLPRGLKLDAKTGRISGVPRRAGTYRFRVQVADAAGARSSLGYVLKVSGAGAHR